MKPNNKFNYKTPESFELLAVVAVCGVLSITLLVVIVLMNPAL
jgi:hypothetical protein